MAVYCSVCCCMIFSAHENCGSYRTAETFTDMKGRTQSQITDTCEGCGAIFDKIMYKAAEEIAQAANKIVADLKEKAEQRKIAEKKQADYEIARAKFDAEYWAKNGI